MSPVIGIDLGTTNTVVAVVQDGRPAAIPDEYGNTLLPSVISFHPSGTVLVGRPAKERRLVDAANTIYSVKRLLGRAWDSEEVGRARTRFAFQMREGPGQATLVVGRGETYTLPEISAFVLRRAKQIAEAALGTPIGRAVITVPANFNDLQRTATKVAGRVAGLEVLRILNEPTAAALAYGYGRTSGERLAVYDFGGGTFDVTLLDLTDNVFEVLATAGNTFLGGDDIDLAIAERMATEFLEQHRYDLRTNPQAFERLRVTAELVKQRLSTEQEASVALEDLAHGPGGTSLSLQFRLSRSELERLMRPLVERTFDTCQEALSIARLSPRDFDRVLLVGGSTRAPLVRRRVQNFFGREGVMGSISPDEVVALGAAIQASALVGAGRQRAAVSAPQAAARNPRPSGPDAAALPPPKPPLIPTPLPLMAPGTASPAPGFRAAAPLPLPAFGSTPPTPLIAAARAPRLIDVTPLTLAVETVSGYCDAIIARNTQIPCERRREFVTASDGQTVVRVRVSQGESTRFTENTLLGEVELSGLPAAPRGTIRISVCFGLDASGMLHVSATEVQTGRATAAELRLVGSYDVSDMAARHNQRHTA